MQLNIIKFSHKYTKLQTEPYGELVRFATLLDVIPIELENLSETFRAYDTDNGKYKLPQKGKYLMLLFQPPDYGQLFPTLRRYTQSKEEYYRSRIGREFIVEVFK